MIGERNNQPLGRGGRPRIGQEGKREQHRGGRVTHNPPPMNRIE